MINEADITLRTAVYFEMLKEQEADDEDKRIEVILLLLLSLLEDSGVDFTTLTSKTRLQQLLGDIIPKIDAAMQAHNKVWVNAFKSVMQAITEVTTSNYVLITGKKLVDKLYSASTVSNNKLWSQFVRDPQAGTGVEPLVMINDLRKSVTTQSIRLIKQAWVEKWDFAKIKQVVKGDPKKNFKDGMINKIGNQAKTVTRTLGASVKSFIDYNVGRLFYDHYQWISTIDSATTDICRSRHLQIYRYGYGPRPPAHLNCRSVIVGIAGSIANQTPNNFYDWLRTQPDNVLNSMLTPSETAAVKSGNSAKRDAAFSTDKRLTTEQFGKRKALIQAPTEDAN